MRRRRRYLGTRRQQFKLAACLLGLVGTVTIGIERMSSNETDRDVWLVYDGECPVCRNYCRYVRAREAVGTLHLVDARKAGPLMDEITAAGLDIDQGMVVKVGGQLFYGPDAIRVITLMSTRVGLFNRMAYALFGTPRRAGVAYPVGKAVRNVVLKLLGIRYIGNLDTHPVR